MPDNVCYWLQSGTGVSYSTAQASCHTNPNPSGGTLPMPYLSNNWANLQFFVAINNIVNFWLGAQFVGYDGSNWSWSQLQWMYGNMSCGSMSYVPPNVTLNTDSVSSSTCLAVEDLTVSPIIWKDDSCTANYNTVCAFGS
jgi:hypothetical protein